MAGRNTCRGTASNAAATRSLRTWPAWRNASTSAARSCGCSAGAPGVVIPPCIPDGTSNRLSAADHPGHRALRASAPAPARIPMPALVSSLLRLRRASVAALAVVALAAAPAPAALAATVDGSPGPNRIAGSGAADVLHGNGGADRRHLRHGLPP